jgi:Mg2+/Co2+ transporter CorB
VDTISTEALVISLIILIAISAFFSGSETGMMRVNRYKLKSVINSKSKRRHAAKRVKALLKRPDRLLGLILIGNNFVNILAATLATILAERLYGTIGLLIAPLVLTLVVLIFAELTPKTLAAIYPESIAYPSSVILKPLLTLLYPFVWLINVIANAILRLFGVSTSDVDDEQLDADELRAVVTEASPLIPKRHQKMLINILDLESSTVEDIMVPRRDIVGIDIQDDWDDIVEELRQSQHTRLLVFDGEVDNPLGILHARNLVNVTTKHNLTMQGLKEAMSEVYYIPEGTPLHTQLLNFQRKKERIGAVVDEYGDIQGLVTLEDILEEIVGEFTTDLSSEQSDIIQKADGSLLVNCSITIRDLNKVLEIELPTDGPKTLNGLITEFLEFLPGKNYGFRLYGYPMLVTAVDENRLDWVRIYPDRYREPNSRD